MSNLSQDKKVLVEKDTAKVSCNGVFEGGEVPHPKVYLKIQDGCAVCPYCETIFATN